MIVPSRRYYLWVIGYSAFLAMMLCALRDGAYPAALLCALIVISVISIGPR